MRVLHSQDRSATLVDMDESELEPFAGAEENDDYRAEWSGYTCKCHGWEVQRSANVTIKKSIASLLEAGKLN